MALHLLKHWCVYVTGISSDFFIFCIKESKVRTSQLCYLLSEPIQLSACNMHLDNFTDFVCDFNGRVGEMGHLRSVDCFLLLGITLLWTRQNKLYPHHKVPLSNTKVERWAFPGLELDCAWHRQSNHCAEVWNISLSSSNSGQWEYERKRGELSNKDEDHTVWI